MILVHKYYISQNDLSDVLCSYIFTQEAERRRAKVCRLFKVVRMYISQYFSKDE